MSPPAKGKPLPLHKSIAASAIAACTAEVFHVIQSQKRKESLHTTEWATCVLFPGPDAAP